MLGLHLHNLIGGGLFCGYSDKMKSLWLMWSWFSSWQAQTALTLPAVTRTGTEDGTGLPWAWRPQSWGEFMVNWWSNSQPHLPWTRCGFPSAPIFLKILHLTLEPCAGWRLGALEAAFPRACIYLLTYKLLATRGQQQCRQAAHWIRLRSKAGERTSWLAFISNKQPKGERTDLGQHL